MAKKHFGQNFLTDPAMIERLVRLIAPETEQAFVEIGPGRGALTQALLPHVKELVALEIDKDLIPGLNQHLGQFSNCYIQQADALQFPFDQLTLPRRLVGNLPYNIASPLLFHCLQYAHCFEDLHVMLQKEVVERACAEPGSKTYGRLSVMLQYYARPSCLIKVNPSCFRPQPQVESAFMRLVPYQNKHEQADDEARFAHVVQKSFSHRRKTLRKIFKGILDEQHWQNLDIDPQQRPECLSVADFVQICNIICYNNISIGN